MGRFWHSPYCFRTRSSPDTFAPPCPGSHASDARVADKIIDDVEEATTDVTGKAGALTYENLLDSTSDHDVNDSRCARS
jgi:hypothetical protein